MPIIKLTDNTSLDLAASTGDDGSALKKYLQGDLVFGFADGRFRNALSTPVTQMDPESFPFTASANSSSKFKVSDASLNVKTGASAAINFIDKEEAQKLLKGLQAPDSDLGSPYLSFAVTGNVEAGPAGSVSDFSFGMASGAEVTLTNYHPLTPADSLKGATEATISEFTIPQAPDDLKNLVNNRICRLSGKGSLKFTVSAEYNFLNNTLATVPVNEFLKSLDVKAQGSAKLALAFEHSNEHEVTVFKTSEGKLHLSASVTRTDDLDTSLEITAGITAGIGETDALEFLLDKISGKPQQDIQEIKGALPPDEVKDLTSDIAKVLKTAVDHSVKAALKEDLEQSEETNRLFVYEIDLDDLDETSRSALQSALRGDFSSITANAGGFAGIRELDSVLTITSKRVHTLTIHLLGILNFADVSTFIKETKPAFNQEAAEVILPDKVTAQEIKVSENALDPDKLREVMVKSTVITAGSAVAAGATPEFTFKQVFFLRKARTSPSLLRQHLNTLEALNSPETDAVVKIMGSNKHDYGETTIYASLDLDKQSSTALFLQGGQPIAHQEYLDAARQAMARLLQNDPDNADRYRLFMSDSGLWGRLLNEPASIDRILRDNNIRPMASTDVVAVTWWAAAMAQFANTLGAKRPLGKAEEDVAKKSQGGFDLPWALLAMYLLIDAKPRVNTRFTSALLPAAATSSAAGSRS